MATLTQGLWPPAPDACSCAIAELSSKIVDAVAMMKHFIAEFLVRNDSQLVRAV